MSKAISRQPQVAKNSRSSEISEISFLPAFPGSRAVFMAEVNTRKELRQMQELFDMVGQLAEVVPVSHGTVMSYAVQVHGDNSLFGKVEWLLKTQFTFSLVERNFSQVTLQLVGSLCADSDTELLDLPHCGICDAVDPFPSRAKVKATVNGVEEHGHLAYCAHCTAEHASENAEQMVRDLVRHDKLRLRLTPNTAITLMPEMVEELQVAV